MCLYYEKCKEIAAANVSFIENIKQEKLIRSLYKDAKVHVLPELV